MTIVVLDASALIALLRSEPGADIVAAVLNGAAMTAVNLCEVVGHYSNRGSSQADIVRMIDPLPLERVPFDVALGYEAGMLLPLTRSAGLSLGDRACLALARKLGARALTADRSWSRIAEAVGVTVEIIR